MNNKLNNADNSTNNMGIGSLNYPGRRSAFSPYRPSTLLTNLQRGNIQTQTTSEPPVRSVHQLAALGELFYFNLESNIANKVDENGLTPIIWAAAYGQLAALNCLLSNGADPRHKGPEGETALAFAAANGHSHVVKALLNLGVNVNETDEDGNTPLMYTAYGDHKTCAKELLDHGADLLIENSNLDTAYQISIKRGCREVQTLIEGHMCKLLVSGPKGKAS